MQEAFYAIMEEQIKSKMLAEASPDYTFIVVSQSMVPEEKSQPRRAVICIIGTLLGFIFSIVFVFFLHFYKKES